MKEAINHLFALQASRAHRATQGVVHAGTSDDQDPQLQKFAATPIFKYWIQGAFWCCLGQIAQNARWPARELMFFHSAGAVFLTVLAGVDAAYSGTLLL